MEHTPHLFYRTDFRTHLEILQHGGRLSGMKFAKSFATDVQAIFDNYDYIERMLAPLDPRPAEGSELALLYRKLQEIVEKYVSITEQFLLIEWGSERRYIACSHFERFCELTSEWHEKEANSPSATMAEVTKYTATCLSDFGAELDSYIERNKNTLVSAPVA